MERGTVLSSLSLTPVGRNILLTATTTSVQVTLYQFIVSGTAPNNLPYQLSQSDSLYHNRPQH